MTIGEWLIVLLAVLILAGAIAAMFRPVRGLWWRLPKKTRVIAAATVVLAIVVAHFAR
jgi:hypothetical protein